MTAARQLRLAQRALRTASTHLRQAMHLHRASPELREQLYEADMRLMREEASSRALLAHAIKEHNARRRARRAGMARRAA